MTCDIINDLIIALQEWASSEDYKTKINYRSNSMTCVIIDDLCLLYKTRPNLKEYKTK